MLCDFEEGDRVAYDGFVDGKKTTMIGTFYRPVSVHHGDVDFDKEAGLWTVPLAKLRRVDNE